MFSLKRFWIFSTSASRAHFARIEAAPTGRKRSALCSHLRGIFAVSFFMRYSPNAVLLGLGQSMIASSGCKALMSSAILSASSQLRLVVSELTKESISWGGMRIIL